MTVFSILARWGKAAFLVVFRSIPFVLAIPCALIAPFFVLTVPGDPSTTSWEIQYWLALWASLAAYPLAMVIVAVRLWRSRKTQRIRRIRWHPWIAFLVMAALWSPILIMFANEEVRRAEMRANMPIDQKLEAAIRYGSPEEARTLIAEGADVNMPLFNGGTAGQFAAEQGDWDLVIWLLERGARIDHADRKGWSLRKAVAEAPAETDPDRAASLATVRSMIAAESGPE